jgi:transcriptional regulator of aromatic amino acid metabolism
VLDELGQASLWEFAAQSIASREQLSGTLELSSGDRVPTTCLPVFDGRATVGALIEIETPTRVVPQLRGPRPAAKPTQPRGAWHDVMEHARTLSDRGLPLLVVGEEGVGKVALVREVFAGEYGRGEVTVLDARRQSIDGASAWVKRFGRALGAGGGVVVVRHIEALDSSAARAACGLVDAYVDGPVRLVGTMTHDAAAVYQPLVDRFAVASLRIPPLRDRMQDLPALLVSLTERHSTPGARPPRWLPDAIQTLTRLDWPANVRQLENVVRRVLATCGDADIVAKDLPEEIRGQAPRRRLSRLERVELDAIMTALQQSRGNKSEAASFLGISRATLYRKIRTFGVNLDRNVF